LEANTLFEMALGLGGHWKVTESRFEGEPKKLILKLEPERGLHWKCPECERCGPVHDTVERRWRHLNFFQYESELVAKVPRCQCEKHGVRQVEVPWARPGSGFTLMFEAMVMLLCQQMPVADAAELLGEHDTRLWRIVCEHVERAQEARDWSKVTRILVDETSARRGQRYVTVFVDEQSRQLLFMTPGRKAESVKAFVEALIGHGGKPENIQWVGMDMSAAYAAGVEKYLPGARKAFDHFHIAQLAGAALDEVRRRLHAEHGGLKSARWSILGNEWTRSPEQKEERKTLREEYPKLGRAIGLRESLQDVLASADEESLRWWCGWASRSRLEPFQKLARTLKNHWEGILGFFRSGITSAAIEAINGKLQLAKRMARGFRNFAFFRAISYLKAASLDLNLPPLKPY
jgi:transposase